MPYEVRFLEGTQSGIRTNDVYDWYQDAKDDRNHLFKSNAAVSHTWIERTKNGLTKERIGAVLRREAT